MSTEKEMENLSEFEQKYKPIDKGLIALTETINRGEAVARVLSWGISHDCVLDKDTMQSMIQMIAEFLTTAKEQLTLTHNELGIFFPRIQLYKDKNY